MEKAVTLMSTLTSTPGLGKTTRNMALAKSYMLLKTLTLAITRMVREWEKVYSPFITKTCILENGWMARNMGKVLMSTSIPKPNSLDNGQMESLAKANGFYLMVLSLKDSSSMISQSVKANGSWLIKTQSMESMSRKSSMTQLILMPEAK
jgi:hypothetical protein